MKSGLFRILILVIAFTAISAGSAQAMLCEEDVCKVAMSNYYKYFSHLQTSPSIKVRMEEVSMERIDGINGPVDVYHVKLAKYHNTTFLKVSDFMLYGIEAEDGNIFSVKNIEKESTIFKNALASEITGRDIAGSGSVDYEKYAYFINAAGDEVLSTISAGDKKAVSNVETIIAGIGSYKKNLEPLVVKFGNDLRSVVIMNK